MPSRQEHVEAHSAPACRISPACPGMEAVQRVTARTRNTACGWYTTLSTDSTDTCSERRSGAGENCQWRATSR